MGGRPRRAGFSSSSSSSSSTSRTAPRVCALPAGACHPGTHKQTARVAPQRQRAAPASPPESCCWCAAARWGSAGVGGGWRRDGTAGGRASRQTGRAAAAPPQAATVSGAGSQAGYSQHAEVTIPQLPPLSARPAHPSWHRPACRGRRRPAPTRLPAPPGSPASPPPQTWRTCWRPRPSGCAPRRCTSCRRPAKGGEAGKGAGLEACRGEAGAGGRHGRAKHSEPQGQAAGRTPSLPLAIQATIETPRKREGGTHDPP